MTTTVAGLFIHPLKSCAPLPVARAEVEPRGLAGDRRWLLTDPDGRFVTARQQSRLVLLRALPRPGGGLQIGAPGLDAREIAAPPADGERGAVTVWNDTITPLRGPADGEQALSDWLGQPVRLWFMDARAHRAADPDRARPGDEVSFADALPLLLLSQAALDALNARLPRTIDVARFRPNLLLAGCAPHAEDRWRRIRVGGVAFDVVKDCVRCVLTTVDPLRGERDADGEPLRTLLGYRRAAKGATFGRLAIPRSRGTIAVGDPVEVLDAAT